MNIFYFNFYNNDKNYYNNGYYNDIIYNNGYYEKNEF
jgi:hypothetical protein